MVSSTLTGERRWAARRGGMTVLGKVAVPKPINLPSQRLENHGLDPNVEIVPKGTHSWGSRSSSSSSNAWGSSTLSPSDGGTGSPSYLSGRPSSGGGTRPSTAGSDRGHEPIANVWSSSSRPSSASGPLKSSQTSIASSRPRSADTRPGSSQLSRFAEPLSDNSVAWGALGTAEKLGVAPSKKDSFSLTSGDFPTLGSEKENSTKNTDIEEHVFPHDSPSGGEPVQERTADAVAMDSGSVDVNCDNANAWRRDCSFYEREGVRPNVQQWHADPQPFHNSPISQHFDAWRGPPLNNHPGGGVWYGGPPGGPPFGPHGFPMEAFPYYRPQIPPGAMANAQTAPQQPSAGPRGPHPKHGDVFRPPSHDAYIRPGMPIRPGFYPGPVPYEGYYGPPMAYNGNASERDIPYMGMPVGPAAYNRYPNQNAHESGNSHGRSSGFGTNNGKGFFPEQVESSRHPHDAQGPYKVLLKQHDGWEGKPGEQKWDDNRAANVVHPGKGDHPRNSALENGRRTDQMKRDDDVETKRVLSGRDSGIVDPKIGASSVRLKGTENRGKLDPSDTGLDQISEHGERGASLSESVSCSRDPSLIKKIEGLNAKARAADGRQDAKSVSSKDEQKNKQKFDSIRNNHHPANEAVSGFAPQEQPRSNVSVTAGSFDDKISGRDKSLDLTVSGGTGITRRSTQGMHIGIHHRGKGSSNTQDTDSWRRRTHVTESNDGVSSAHISSVVQDQDCMSIDAAEKSLSHQGNGGELMLQASEPSDTQAQRAKMRELARQRLKQREKEEEERTREQKAKALAKLEELNRRMQLGEGSSQKLETSSSTTLPNKQEELLNSTQPSVIANASAANSVLASNSVAVAPTNEGIANRVEILAPFSNEVLQEESKKNSSEAPVVMHDPSKSQHQDSGAESVINNVRQEYDGATKQKRMNNRQKQNSYSERTSGDKVSLTTTEASKTHNTDAMPDPSVPLQAVGLDIASNSEANLPVSPSATAESSASHHRRKNRSTRNKQKAEEVVPPTVGSPTSVPSIDTTTALEVSNECVKPKTLEASVVASSSVQLVQDRKGASGQQPMEQQHPTSPNGDVQVKSSSNQWKPQSSRRMSRNPQSNNKTMDNKFHGSSDTVIWAPVRSHNNKSDGAADEGNKKSAESASLPHVKSGDQQVQNTITKNKRAEMERYVPKPVAKEMAQQGNANHSVVSSSVVVQMTSHETVVGSVSIPLRPESAQTSVTLQFGSIAEATRNAEGTRQIKPGKVQGSSWRQHSSAESQTSTSNLSFQKSTESQRQPHNISEAISSVKEQLSEQNDEWTDGWTMPEEPNAPVPVSSFKDQTATARGRRQPQKGQSRVGYNPDSVETRIGGDIEKAHTQSWLPKSQSTSATGQRTTKPNNNDGQNVVTAEACSRPNKRGSSSTTVGVSVPPPRDKEVAAGRTNEVYPSDQESGRRERKVVTSHKGYNNSGGPIEPPAFDQNYSSSGYRRGSGNQSNRDLQEARGEWSGTARDNNRQHNVPGANREKPMRQSSHYEYQPVGQQNKSKGTNFEPSSNDGSHASGSRFRERVPNHARRGGGDFHGRQGGSFRVLDTNTD